MGGDGGGGGLDGEVGLEESLVVCEGPTISITGYWHLQRRV